MDALSDDDFERVSDLDLTDSESEQDRSDRETPSSTPPSTRILRAPDRKTICCTYEGCPKTFNRKARLEEHLRSHTNSRIFRCHHTGCVKDFLRESHLKHHLKSAHSNIRDYKCTWEGCDKKFATGTRLRRHFQAHEGREKYRCRGYEGCNQTFRKHETLQRHIVQIHEQMKPFPCNDLDVSTGRECDKAFDTAEKLRVHQRSRHDGTRFSCTECLSSSAKLANSVSALSAQQFNAFFATYSDLQIHIAEFHPPTCCYCPTSFTTSKELTRHLELQHGIIDPNTPTADAFKCSFPNCGRQFTKRGNLTVHMKTVHEKKKEFICGESDVAMPKELHDDGPVEVYGCGRAFTTKATLEDHVRSAHLGMTSLQVERRNKRKAEKREADSNEIDFEPKARKPRKDKGVKKTSILETLSGAPLQYLSAHPLVVDPTLTNSSVYTNDHIASMVEAEVGIKAESEEDEDDEDDWNQLSGSMVLLGDRLYHNGEQYEYTASQYPPGLSPPHVSGNMSPITESNAGYSKTSDRDFQPSDDDPFFGGFEHEPETMSGRLRPSYPMLKVEH